MGNFGGHALPGSFFILFAIYWSIQIYRRILRRPIAYSSSGVKAASNSNNNYESVKNRNVHEEDLYRSSVTFPVDCCTNPKLAKFPWEGFFKVFFTTVGLTLEIITAFKDGHFVHLGNAQHATMFFAFALAGIVDILMHCGVPLPHNSDYAVSTIAFVVEDILFMFHLHGRSPLDMMLHTMLVYVIHACVVVCLLEMFLPRSPLVALGRAYLVLLQGTWFWQLGFILYNPIPGHVPWESENHDQMMIGAVIFAWHVIGDIIVVLAIGLVMRLLYARCGVGKGCYSGSHGVSSNGRSQQEYEVIKLISKGTTSDSDTEEPVVVVG